MNPVNPIGGRLPLLAALALAAFAVLVARLASLQSDPSLPHVADDNALRTERLDAPRGRILDRHGVVLAAARPSVDLRLLPSEVEDPALVREVLEPLLDEAGRERLDEALAATGVDAHATRVIARDLDLPARSAVAARGHRLAGLTLAAAQLRHYPEQARASHALGYVSEVTGEDLLRLDADRYRPGDQTGRQGIERLLERDLRGLPGLRSHVVDAHGRPVEGAGPWFERLRGVAASWDRPVQGGADVSLTLDHHLQAVAEEALAGRRGAVAMIDVRTGAVLVYASSPDPDADALVAGLSRGGWQALQDDPARPLLDRVSRGLYPPASTFKLVTAAAALEDGVSPHHSVVCNGGYQVGRRRFKCWKRGGHGRVDLTAALAGSCDVWFYEVGIRLGPEKIADAAARFGLGSPTGLALNGERGGLLPSPEWIEQRYGYRWGAGDSASVSIGQGILLTTPIQLAVMAATVAADGERPVPYIVEQVTRPDGTTARIGGLRAPIDTGFSTEALAAVREGMVAVMERGTARSQAIEGLPTAGKTGTAQTVSAKLKAERPGPETEDHALFVAYAPAEAPRVAIAVVMEHAGGGSAHAAPIARRVLSAWGVDEGLIPEPEEDVADALVDVEVEH